MLQLNYVNAAGRKLVTSKTVFMVTIIVIPLTFLSTWLFGLGQHRTIFENSIYSITILSIAFFLFLTIGLYNGIKLKDNIGQVTDRMYSKKNKNVPDISQAVEFPTELPGAGDGIEGILVGIVLWFVMSILMFLFIWLLGVLLWPMILVFTAMLYWIFFRALRLVFKNANKCKGNLKTSSLYALAYTTLYSFWIYGIILSTHYLIK
jgi:hypothetical protein